MTEFVRRFIKNNAEHINEEDWYTVFKEWYNASDSYWEYDDAVLFPDFVNSLTIANIDCIETSKEERKRVIETVLIPVFDNFVAGGSRTILKETVVFALVTYLGFTNKEIEKIADNIASTFHLHIDFEHYEKLR